jgi:hypothetical protein
MNTLRKDSLQHLYQNEKEIRSYDNKNIVSFFASNVFDDKKQRQYLSDEAYKSLRPIVSKPGAKSTAKCCRANR